MVVVVVGFGEFFTLGDLANAFLFFELFLGGSRSFFFQLAENSGHGPRSRQKKQKTKEHRLGDYALVSTMSRASVKNRPGRLDFDIFLLAFLLFGLLLMLLLWLLFFFVGGGGVSRSVFSLSLSVSLSLVERR